MKLMKFLLGTLNILTLYFRSDLKRILDAEVVLDDLWSKVIWHKHHHKDWLWIGLLLVHYLLKHGYYASTFKNKTNIQGIECLNE
jgi:hypothetical protein